MPTIWSIFITVHWLVAIYAVTSVLRRRSEPMAMLAWIFAICVLPLVGSAFYGLLGSNRVKRKANRRRRRAAHLIDAIEREAERSATGHAAHPAQNLPPDLQAIERLGKQLVHIPATVGNEVAVSNLAEETYRMLEASLRGARHHIHLQYYIWQPDQTGIYFRDLLAQRAREGVECRLLLDSVGCWKLRRSFLRPLLDAGVHVAWFMPIYPFRRRRWSPHLRNHRKIAVIDGRTAFVGSQNIGDEYRGRLKRLSPWYDSHMRIRGPAALFLQQTFAEDWVFATEQVLAGSAYFPTESSRPGASAVQILPTGPDQDVSVLGQLVFAAVSTARDSIRIATPYFVPDPGLRMALMHARYRGVKVQLVLPTRSDSPLVLRAGRSYYAELLDVGAEVHEFDGGMLHSKIITIDDRWCMLGSANMDVRSFRLNFEITAIIYDEKVSQGLAAEIERHRAASRQILPRDVWRKNVAEQIIEGGARLFAPLL